MAIDGLFDLALSENPRIDGIQKIAALRDQFIHGFQGFFNEDREQMETAALQIRALLDAVTPLVAELDPTMEIVPGIETAFKIRLFADTIECMELLLRDLNLLIVAVTDWTPDEAPEDGNDTSALSRPSSPTKVTAKPHSGRRFFQFDPLEYVNKLDAVKCEGGIEDEFMQGLAVVLEATEAILKHGAETSNYENASVDKIQSVRVRASFRKGPSLYKEINCKPFDKELGPGQEITDDPRVKLTVVVKALHNAKMRVGEIEKICLKYIIL